MAKDFAKAFYSSARWQSCRNSYAERVHHLCENCLRQGLMVPGEIVHHKIAITPTNIENPEITLNHLNLEMLCRHCHEAKHDIGRGRFAKINEERARSRAAARRFVIQSDGKVVPYESVGQNRSGSD